MGILDVLGLVTDFFGNPFVGGIAAQVEAERQQKREDKFRADELERLGAVKDPLFAANLAFANAEAAVSGDVLGREIAFFEGAGQRFADVADPLLGDVGERTRLGIEGAEDIVGGFGDLETQGALQGRDLLAAQHRRARLLQGELRGLGAEEGADISARFSALGRTEQARLAGLGLGGTSGAASVAAGVERLRSRELGLFNERIRGERLGLSERLGAEELNLLDLTGQRELGLARDTLGAQGEALQFATDLRGEDIEATGRLGFAGLTFADQAAMTSFDRRREFGADPARLARDAAQRNFDTEAGITFLPPGPGRQNELAQLAAS